MREHARRQPAQPRGVLRREWPTQPNALLAQLAAAQRDAAEGEPVERRRLAAERAERAEGVHAELQTLLLRVRLVLGCAP